MSKEAMKLALEALQKIYIAPEHEEYIRVWWPACEQAITALREALAEQPAQQALDKMAENARELGLDYEPAQQEPVFTYDQVKAHIQAAMMSAAQRTWVGLTHDEIKAAYLAVSEIEWAICGMDDAVPFTRIIEAKLKEKNGL